MSWRRPTPTGSSMKHEKMCSRTTSEGRRSGSTLFSITIGTFVGGAVTKAARHPMSATHGKSLRLLTGQAGKHTPAEHEEMGELVPHAEFAGIYGSTEGGNFVTRTTRAQEMARPGT